jgi:hypothetical protein
MTGVLIARSPKEGKKSVPPERIVPRDSASAWTASSSVLGRKYNRVISAPWQGSDGRTPPANYWYTACAYL